MRYLVISDVHGGSEELRRALSFFKLMQCDYIISLGDLLNHGPRNGLPRSYDPLAVGEMLNAYKRQIIAVRGNCDSEVDSMVLDFPGNAPYAYLTVRTPKGNCRRIFLTHGHLYKLDTKEQLEKLGLSEDDIVLSGHTHVSGIFKKTSGIININPGSVTIPKGGTKAGIGIITESAIELLDLDGGKICSYEL